jgi:hypothetical protein
MASAERLPEQQRGRSIYRDMRAGPAHPESNCCDVTQDTKCLWPPGLLSGPGGNQIE